MIWSWRWFIHPATAIRTNRKGSRTLSMLSLHYHLRSSERHKARRIHGDPIFGPYEVSADAQRDQEQPDHLEECITGGSVANASQSGRVMQWRKAASRRVSPIFS